MLNIFYVICMLVLKLGCVWFIAALITFSLRWSTSRSSEQIQGSSCVAWRLWCEAPVRASRVRAQARTGEVIRQRQPGGRPRERDFGASETLCAKKKRWRWNRTYNLQDRTTESWRSRLFYHLATEVLWSKHGSGRICHRVSTKTLGTSGQGWGQWGGWGWWLGWGSGGGWGVEGWWLRLRRSPRLMIRLRQLRLISLGLLLSIRPLSLNQRNHQAAVSTLGSQINKGNSRWRKAYQEVSRWAEGGQF